MLKFLLFIFVVTNLFFSCAGKTEGTSQEEEQLKTKEYDSQQMKDYKKDKETGKFKE